jgi:hypothetical protein
MCHACIATGAPSAVACAATMAEMIDELGLPLVTMGYGVWALACRLMQQHAACQPWMAEQAKKENS